MNKITIQDIRDLKPCYDPSKYLPEDWTGTIEDILLLDECPAKDRIWVAVRLVPRFIAECFAIDCAFAAHAYAYASAYAFDASEFASASSSADDSAYASEYAYDASASASTSASASASASASYVAALASKKQERENQVDALLMLLGDVDD